MTDFIDMTTLPTLLKELSHASKEQEVQAKDTAANLTALKSEFDESVQGTAVKIQELEKVCLEAKKGVVEQMKSMTKLTVSTQKAEVLADKLQESTRKVQFIDGKFRTMEQAVGSLEDQVSEFSSVRQDVDDARKSVASLASRADAVETVNQGLAKSINNLLGQIGAATDTSGRLREDLTSESRARSEEHSNVRADVSSLTEDIFLFLRALGGVDMQQSVNFRMISHTGNEGLIDKHASRLQDLEEGAETFKGEIGRVDALGGQMLKVEKNVKSISSQLADLKELQCEMSAKLQELQEWKQLIQFRLANHKEAAGEEQQDAGKPTPLAKQARSNQKEVAESPDEDGRPGIAKLGQMSPLREQHSSQHDASSPSRAEARLSTAQLPPALSPAQVKQVEESVLASLQPQLSDLRNELATARQQLAASQQQLAEAAAAQPRPSVARPSPSHPSDVSSTAKQTLRPRAASTEAAAPPPASSSAPPQRDIWFGREPTLGDLSRAMPAPSHAESASALDPGAAAPSRKEPLRRVASAIAEEEDSPETEHAPADTPPYAPAASPTPQSATRPDSDLARHHDHHRGDDDDASEETHPLPLRSSSPIASESPSPVSPGPSPNLKFRAAAPSLRSGQLPAALLASFRAPQAAAAPAAREAPDPSPGSSAAAPRPLGSFTPRQQASHLNFNLNLRSAGGPGSGAPSPAAPSPYRHRERPSNAGAASPDLAGSVFSVASSFHSASSVPDFSAAPEEAFALLYHEVGQLRQTLRKHLGAKAMPGRGRGVASAASNLPWQRETAISGFLSSSLDGHAAKQQPPSGDMASPTSTASSVPGLVLANEVDRFFRDALYMLRRELGMLRGDVAEFKLRAKDDPAAVMAEEALGLAKGNRDAIEAMQSDLKERSARWENRNEMLKARLEQARSEAATNLRKAKEEMRADSLDGLDAKLQRLQVALSSVESNVAAKLQEREGDGEEVHARLANAESMCRQCAAAMAAAMRRVGTLETVAARQAIEGHLLEEQEELRRKYAYHLDFTPFEGLQGLPVPASIDDRDLGRDAEALALAGPGPTGGPQAGHDVHRGPGPQAGHGTGLRENFKSGAQTDRGPLGGGRRPPSGGRMQRPQSARRAAAASTGNWPGLGMTRKLSGDGGGPDTVTVTVPQPPLDLDLVAHTAALASVGKLDLSVRRLAVTAAPGPAGGLQAHATGSADRGSLAGWPGPGPGHWHQDARTDGPPHAHQPAPETGSLAFPATGTGSGSFVAQVQVGPSRASSSGSSAAPPWQRAQPEPAASAGRGAGSAGPALQVPSGSVHIPQVPERLPPSDRSAQGSRYKVAATPGKGMEVGLVLPPRAPSSKRLQASAAGPTSFQPQ